MVREDGAVTSTPSNTTREVARDERRRGREVAGHAPTTIRQSRRESVAPTLPSSDMHVGNVRSAELAGRTHWMEEERQGEEYDDEWDLEEEEEPLWEHRNYGGRAMKVPAAPTVPKAGQPKVVALSDVLAWYNSQVSNALFRLDESDRSQYFLVCPSSHPLQKRSGPGLQVNYAVQPHGLASSAFANAHTAKFAQVTGCQCTARKYVEATFPTLDEFSQAEITGLFSQLLLNLLNEAKLEMKIQQSEGGKKMLMTDGGKKNEFDQMLKADLVKVLSRTLSSPVAIALLHNRFDMVSEVPGGLYLEVDKLLSFCPERIGLAADIIPTLRGLLAAVFKTWVPHGEDEPYWRGAFRKPCDSQWHDTLSRVPIFAMQGLSNGYNMGRMVERWGLVVESRLADGPLNLMFMPSVSDAHVATSSASIWGRILPGVALIVTMNVDPPNLRQLALASLRALNSARLPMFTCVHSYAVLAHCYENKCLRQHFTTPAQRRTCCEALSDYVNSGCMAVPEVVPGCASTAIVDVFQYSFSDCGGMQQPQNPHEAWILTCSEDVFPLVRFQTEVKACKAEVFARSVCPGGQCVVDTHDVTLDIGGDGPFQSIWIPGHLTSSCEELRFQPNDPQHATRTLVLTGDVEATEKWRLATGGEFRVKNHDSHTKFKLMARSSEDRKAYVKRINSLMELCYLGLFDPSNGNGLLVPRNMALLRSTKDVEMNRASSRVSFVDRPATLWELEDVVEYADDVRRAMDASLAQDYLMEHLEVTDPHHIDLINSIAHALSMPYAVVDPPLPPGTNLKDVIGS